MKDEVEYGQYVVVMLDLLGQSQMYKELEALQRKSPFGSEEFRDQLIRFIRSVEYFKRGVDSFLEGNQSKSMPDFLPDEAREFYSKAGSDITRIQRFSDGIMVYVPLMKNGKSFPISSVMTAFCCTGTTILSQFAAGNPIRVGIGLGGAAEIEDGELFGPAIAHAHYMESEKADYPRVAVHENVIEYLDSFSELSEKSDTESKYQFEMAKLCRAMIVRDIDGIQILDYLGHAMWDVAFRGGDQALIDEAFNFIAEQKDRFHKVKRIFRKYRYAYNYFTNSKRVVA